MTFIDDLALVEVLLLLGAAVFAYSGVMVWWAIRKNQPSNVKAILRGAAVPIGFVGAASTGLAMWGEMTWPFPSFLAGYNILFWDAYLLFGLLLLSYAAATYFGARLQYTGVFALVAGGVTAFYGYTGYTATYVSAGATVHGYTKDPLATLLLYVGFATASILALPAALVVDYFLDATAKLAHPFTSSRATAVTRPRGLGSRAAQPITTDNAPATPKEEGTTVYHVPYWVQTLLLLFPIFMAIAAFAALWYFGVTLPGHLGSGPAASP